MSEMVRIRMRKLHSLFSCFLPIPSFKHQQHHHLLQLITMHQDEEDQDHNLSYYNHHFFRPPQALICSAPVSVPSNPIKFSYEEDGFHLATAKKRKPDIADSDRVVQAPGKKDRHSKVRTARGPRDRRVRLSPRTAIQFYDVQDRLGYDRPSKAIDWLIREAQSAIDALNPDLPNNAPASLIIPPLIEHSDVVSGFVHGELQGYIDHQQDLGLAWDCGNGNSGGGGAPEYFSCDPPPLYSRPVSGHGHMFYQREPLQSSFINYSPINADFAGLDFCNELANVTASDMMKEDEKINFCKSSSMAPFLHFED